MKQLTSILITLQTLLLIASCKKQGDDSPATAPVDTVAFVHHITFNAPIQYSLGNAIADTVTIIYNENVDILVPKEGYVLSYALHLKEDFTNSILNTFRYTTVNGGGVITTDWADDNLNNLTGKIVTDTTIAGAAIVKVNVKRAFTFKKIYADHASATSALDSISKLRTDKITFSSYLYFTKTYPATTTSTSIFYTR